MLVRPSRCISRVPLLGSAARAQAHGEFDVVGEGNRQVVVRSRAGAGNVFRARIRVVGDNESAASQAIFKQPEDGQIELAGARATFEGPNSLPITCGCAARADGPRQNIEKLAGRAGDGKRLVLQSRIIVEIVVTIAGTLIGCRPLNPNHIFEKDVLFASSQGLATEQRPNEEILMSFEFPYSTAFFTTI